MLALLPPYRRRTQRHKVRLGLAVCKVCLGLCSSGGLPIHGPSTCTARIALQAVEFVVEVALPAVVLALGFFFSVSTLVLLF